jgi:hypothetical protein
MGFLSEYEGTDRIFVVDGSEEWWVDVRKCLSDKETQEISKASLKKVLDARNAVNLETLDEGGIRATLTPEDLQENQRLTVLLSVVGWNLTDENEEVLPFAPRAALEESLTRLPGFVTTRLTQEVVRRNTVTSAEAQSFPPASVGSSEVSENNQSDHREILV